MALRPEGELVKLKTPWAFRLTAFLINPLGKILEAIAEDRADDLMAFLRPNREDLAAWVEVALVEVGALVRTGIELGEAWRGRKRRAFWEAVVATFPHPHQHLVQKAAARAYEGRPPEAIWEEARTLLRRGNVARPPAAHLDEVLAGRGYRAERERAKELDHGALLAQEVLQGLLGRSIPQVDDDRRPLRPLPAAEKRKPSPPPLYPWGEGEICAKRRGFCLGPWPIGSTTWAWGSAPLEG